LTDHSIAGTYYHNRFRREKRGDKYPARTDPSEWIPIPCDPIISKEEFDAIQVRLAQNKYLSSRNSKNYYLLGRRIKCACGRALGGDTHRGKRIYRCVGSKSVAAVKCRPTVQLPADVTEDFVWAWLVTQLETEGRTYS
jgi:site-specific DNA recombinase